MEVNKEEAIRCLHIAQKHRSSGNYPSAIKFARKSVALFETPEGVAMISVVEREMESGGASSSSSSATPNQGSSQAASSSSSSAKATGVEEHVTSAHQRAGHGTSSRASTSAQGEGSGQKKTYTTKQVEIVKRIKSYQHHQYYEILSVEKTCTENDVKRSYKKVLSDANLRAIFDSNPHSDPTQRGGGGGAASRSGFGHPGFSNGGGFQGEINPEDLFNMFFGGGGMGGGGFGNANVFTFGGPGGFHAQFGGPRRRPNPGAAPAEPASPLAAILPLLLLFAFAMISIIPSLFGGGTDPNPKWSFDQSPELSLHRHTWNRGIDYFVNQAQWEASPIYESIPEAKRGEQSVFTPKVRQFERNIENTYIRMLQNECEYFIAERHDAISRHSGIFGIGADHDKIQEWKTKSSPACEQLRAWGMLSNRGQNF